jgi:hypothetical protein
LFWWLDRKLVKIRIRISWLRNLLLRQLKKIYS